MFDVRAYVLVVVVALYHIYTCLHCLLGEEDEEEERKEKDDKDDTDLDQRSANRIRMNQTADTWRNNSDLTWSLHECSRPAK
jgi:hypothetical protein